MTPRVYIDSPLAEGAEVALPEAAAHHARVLRLREGDTITLFDGRGGEWRAQLIGARRAMVRSFEPVERESPLAVTLVQGVSSGDRMDYTVQKAVELGVVAIQPVLTRKGVVRLEGRRAQSRLEHWHRVVISACEQCGRNRVPLVHPIATFQDFVTSMQSPAPRLLLSAEGRSIREFPVQAEATIAAGPEAGFASEERAALEQAGFVKASLGPRVLRTETAALAALAALNALRGDF
jgi:16S rRNA (uracil1498-N3)-methyltransferase